MFERASAPKRIVFHRFSRKGQRALRPAARVCNALLPVTGAALFAWGCGAALALRTPLEEALPGPVTLLAGFLAFDMLHECGHMTANCACGCPVEEIGLLLEPDMAFYVRNDSGPIVSARGRRQYLQICLAGIETDLAAIGVLLWSCARTGSRTCAFFALFNMISVVHNALPVCAGASTAAVRSACFGQYGWQGASTLWCRVSVWWASGSCSFEKNF